GADDGKADAAERDRVCERQHARMVVVPCQLRREPRDLDGGADEGRGGRGQVRERQPYVRCTRTPNSRRHTVRRRIRTRTTPGSGSSVIWMKPRSSSCG